MKNIDVAYCEKLSVVRERGLAAVSRGGTGRVSVLKNEVNTAGLPLSKILIACRLFFIFLLSNHSCFLLSGNQSFLGTVFKPKWVVSQV